MPSPFPGMDPYLEEAGLWPDVHHRLITISSDILAAMLRPKYYIRIEERVYISDETDPGRAVIAPDIRISWLPGHETRQVERDDGTSVLIAEPIVARTMFQEEIREARLEIIDRAQRLVVTVIEVLSPANKYPSARGEKSYEEKRLEVMQSPSHLVEIDLLRAGSAIDVEGTLPPHDYLVHISRVEKRPKGLLWPIELTQRLPIIPVPLKPEDDSVPLDLQQVLDTAYDRAGYDLELDYRAEARPPLPPHHAEWADKLLKSKGLR